MRVNRTSMKDSRHLILIVDDDSAARAYMSDFVSVLGYSVECVGSGEDAIERLDTGVRPLLILLDLQMAGVDGFGVLDHVRTLDRPVPVIIVSASGQVRTVVDAMKRGAGHYLCKPFEEQELELAIRNVVEKWEMQERIETLEARLSDFGDGKVITCDSGMLRILEVARQVADTDVPVLILGESGVGKEVVARYIHDRSPRTRGAFVKVNCAALPHELLESELFGYERGAFTGAVSDKPGKFELAHGGTILLDEIGEMSPYLQAKLLHVLQDGEFSRLGGKRPVQSDARVIALTNLRIQDAVADGEFREDLYFRLNVIGLDIPPLRHRQDDIALLCGHFVRKYRQEYKSEIEHIPAEVISAFIRHDWPGNVRQLENAVRRFLILRDVKRALAELGGSDDVPEPTGDGRVSLKEVAARAAESAEREVALRMLNQTNWNRKEAARRLDICYKSLLNKLKKWDLKRSVVSDSHGPRRLNRQR
jgi:two-component system response regulator AtoC